eukprot:4070778-Amphidinium_carterae.1
MPKPVQETRQHARSEWHVGNQSSNSEGACNDDEEKHRCGWPVMHPGMPHTTLERTSGACRGNFKRKRREKGGRVLVQKRFVGQEAANYNYFVSSGRIELSRRERSVHSTRAYLKGDAIRLWHSGLRGFPSDIQQ